MNRCDVAPVNQVAGLVSECGREEEEGRRRKEKKGGRPRKLPHTFSVP